MRSIFEMSESSSTTSMRPLPMTASVTPLSLPPPTTGGAGGGGGGRRGSSSVRVALDLLDLLVRDCALKRTKSTQPEAVPATDVVDRFHLRDGEVLAQRIGLVAPLHGERHRLGHARERHLRRETEVEVEIHLAGHFDQSALDDQHIAALLDDSA